MNPNLSHHHHHQKMQQQRDEIMWDLNDSPDPITINQVEHHNNNKGKQLVYNNNNNNNNDEEEDEHNIMMTGDDSTDNYRLFGFCMNDVNTNTPPVTHQFFPMDNETSSVGVKLMSTSEGTGNMISQPVKKSRRGPRSRSSQYRGVTFYRRTGRWESHIWFDHFFYSLFFYSQCIIIIIFILLTMFLIGIYYYLY